MRGDIEEPLQEVKCSNGGENHQRSERTTEGEKENVEASWAMDL